jgi:hypothetical protein
MPRQSPPLPPDGIYRAILLVLVVSLLAGAVITLAGELVWHSPGLSQAGTWLVVAAGGAYLFFRVLGAREARRRAAEAASESEDGPGVRGGEP